MGHVTHVRQGNIYSSLLWALRRLYEKELFWWLSSMLPACFDCPPVVALLLSPVAFSVHDDETLELPWYLLGNHILPIFHSLMGAKAFSFSLMTFNLS